MPLASHALHLLADTSGGSSGGGGGSGLLGFLPLYRLPDYVKDMEAVTHDYILMGLDLKTDEEYAGMG